LQLFKFEQLPLLALSAGMAGQVAVLFGW